MFVLGFYLWGNRTGVKDVVPARRFDLAEIEVSPRARLIVFVKN
jgi:hypothetical protein